MIKIEKLNKVYSNGVVAVKDLNLTINQGDIFGIIGLSGAGKSSLIRMLNRLEEPTSGDIFIENINIVKSTKKELLDIRKGIGMIFQHFNLLSSRNVSENIAFALEIAKYPTKNTEARVDELLKLVSLEDKKHAYPSQLSGGQKQRVAIARALANHPKILLSDEATSALDPKTTKSILALLREIQEKVGVTVVLITHQMEVIREVCNKVAVMSNGEIVETGSVQEIFSNPQKEITRELISYLPSEPQKEVEIIKKKGSKIVKLIFLGSTTTEPIISRVVRKFDLDINILEGSVDILATTQVGHLIIEFLGDMEKQDSAIEWIKNSGIKVEVVYGGI